MRLLLILSLFSTSLMASPLQELTQLLAQIKTFQAEFKQTIKDQHGQQVALNQGNVIIARPGKFYWKSQQPNPILVIADGVHLWNYDIELAQVTKQSLKNALGRSPAALLAGDTVSLEKNFNVTSCGERCYQLKPKQSDAHFANVTLTFKNQTLNRIQMQDPLGQDVNTIFTQVKINQAVKPRQFVFNVPAGVDVIAGE